MKTIFKYRLNTIRHQALDLPSGSKILHVGMQDDWATMWVLVDTEMAQREMRFIETFGTGHPIPNNVAENYIGTVQDGSFVWHFFEAK